MALHFKGKPIGPPKREKKKVRLSPWLLLPLIGLLLLMPLVGFLTPQGPVMVAVGVGDPSTGPPVISAGAFSCRPSSEIGRAPSFAIDTNSTIDNFNLQAKIRKVTVDVHGPDGSAGLFCINVPKNIMGDRIRTFLDGLPANARVEDLGENFVVSLGYSHSEREIVILGELEEEPTAPPRPQNQTVPGAGMQQQQQVVVVGPGAPAPPPPHPVKVFVREPVDLCPPETLTPGSLVASGVPVVFSSDENPSVTGALGTGIHYQTKTRTVVNFMSDVGDKVSIKFKVDNLSKEDSLVRLRFIASDNVLVDIIESAGVDVVRVLKSDEFLVKVDGGAKKADLDTRLTPIATGLHPFILEIAPLFEPLCPGP